jgi:hypothetical protein
MNDRGIIKKLAIGVFMAISVACSLGGCGSNGTEGDGLVTSTGQYHSLQFTLTTPSVAVLGDIVPITFTVTNLHSKEIRSEKHEKAVHRRSSVPHLDIAKMPPSLIMIVTYIVLQTVQERV